MPPTKGKFFRRKSSSDDTTTRSGSSLALLGMDASGRRPSAFAGSGGGTVPMLTGSSKGYSSRSTPVVTSSLGGAAGLVFAPAPARRNLTTPTITYVKGPVSGQGSAHTSMNAQHSHSFSGPSSKPAQEGHHNNDFLPQPINRSTTEDSVVTSSSKGSKQTLLRSRSDAKQLVNAGLSRFAIGKRKKPQAGAVKATIPKGTTDNAGKKAGYHYSSQLDHTDIRRPSSTSTGGSYYSLSHSSPPPTPPMKSPWLAFPNSSAASSQVPLLPTQTLFHQQQQAASVGSTPPHSPFPYRSDASVTTVPARASTSMSRFASNASPISPEDAMLYQSSMRDDSNGPVSPMDNGRHSRASTPNARKPTGENDMIVEIINLRRAVKQKDEMIRRLDPTGMVSGNPAQNPDGSRNNTMTSTSSSHSELQRVNQVLDKQIAELRAKLSEAQSLQEQKLSEAYQSHACMVEALRSAHSTHLEGLRTAIDRLEGAAAAATPGDEAPPQRSFTPPPRLPPLLGLSFDVHDDSPTSPKMATQLQRTLTKQSQRNKVLSMADLEDLRMHVNLMDKFVNSQVTDFAEELEKHQQKLQKSSDGKSREKEREREREMDRNNTMAPSGKELMAELEEERRLRKDAERKLADALMHPGRGNVKNILAPMITRLQDELEEEKRLRKEENMFRRQAEDKLHQTIQQMRGDLENILTEQGQLRQDREEQLSKKCKELDDALKLERRNRIRAEEAVSNLIASSSNPADLRGAYEKLKLEHDTVLSELGELKPMYEEYVREADGLHHQMDRMEKENSELKIQRDDLFARATELTQKLSYERKKIKQLQKSSYISSSEGEESKKQHLHELSVELKKTKARLSTAEAALAKKKQECDVLLARQITNTPISAPPELAGRLSSLNDENLQLKARLRNIEEDLSRAFEEASLWRRRLEQYMGQQAMVLTDLEDKVNVLRKEKSSMERKMGKLRRALEDMREKEMVATIAEDLAIRKRVEEEETATLRKNARLPSVPVGVELAVQIPLEVREELAPLTPPPPTLPIKGMSSSSLPLKDEMPLPVGLPKDDESDYEVIIW